MLAACVVPCWAAKPKTHPTSGSDRLYLSFIEDATVIEKQWWEGQLEIRNGDDVDAAYLRGIVAIQPMKDLEVGARMAFGNTDASAGLPDGSGGTDLDLWGKYYLGSDPKQTEFAVGGTLTIPTGDDTAGLGDDAFSLAGFGALRYRLPKWIITANAGVRLNGNGQTLGLPEQDGKVSLQLGGGAIIPLSDPVQVVGEVRYESERFEGGFDLPGYETDLRVLGGLNWRGVGRGQIRGAAAFGLTDGAPDLQLIGGYAVTF
jgi:hypothetical protein